MTDDPREQMTIAARQWQTGLKVAKAGSWLVFAGYVLIMIPIPLCIGVVLWTVLQ